ncbi:Putative Phage Integrase/recombinase [Bradyrhizobium sp. ORS 278]|uniref:tyrosine-type recombinase/integrase n=1 Tax=Bradyrhizobium sp. (strain ORS 278) TaxID=114615 RepID=UPI0001508E39|nr:tyrosine-type recombinase/integrase [Bradyrhizobium sp. ORS 278]CAL77058.1 Putative Phage Integrase/recombinase [Bradyrhizobium sp. ORS 278]
MADMPRPRPPHLQRGVSRHGKVYWFDQMRRGAPKTRIRGEYGSAEFMAAYDAAVTGGAAKPTPEIKAPKGTLEWAWMLYRQSGAWQSGLSQATRRQRENIMKHVLKTAASTPLSDIDAAAIADGIDRRAKTPSQAKNFLQTMNQFFAWLKRAKIVSENPCDGAELPKRPKTGGFKKWSLDDVELYEKRWPIGTRERVMLDDYMYTGLRRGDAAVVGKQHVRNGVISLQTEKAGQWVHIPLLDVLKRTLEAGPVGDLAWNATKSGRPFAKESLGNAFKDACVAAGVRDKSAHGLRKAAATRAADNGATAHELMAIFRWVDIKEAELYTRAADRKRLAAQAMGKLEK